MFKLGDYTTAHRDNVAWSLSRLEVEQLKLLSSLEALEPGTPEATALVNRRFNALYSRSHTIGVGSAYEALLDSPKTSQAHSELTGIIAEMETIMDGPAARLPQHRDRLIALTQSLTDPIRRLSGQGILAYAGQKEQDRLELSSKLLQVTGLSLLLVLALVSLTALLWQLYRLYRQRALENRQVLNRLKTILDTSQDAVLVVCQDGSVIHRNRAADVMFFGGATVQKDQTDEMPQISDVLLRRSAEGELEPVSGQKLLASCADGPNLCSRVLGQAPSGDVFPVELSADKALRAGQEVVICFIRNIARRMADQAELLAARDRALSGETAKARFLGMVSHEMRTPLTGMLGAIRPSGRHAPGPSRKKGMCRSCKARAGSC